MMHDPHTLAGREMVRIMCKYREWLHIPRVDGIISLYHQYRKDGKYACYGKVPNSRGGVSRTENIRRYRSQDTQPQEPQEAANRFKDWRNVADLAGGPGSVRGVSKEHRQIRINSFILSVAAWLVPDDWNPLGNQPLMCRYLLSILPCFVSFSKLYQFLQAPARSVATGR